ncbi:MAG: glycine dehydrogenase (aminomethyl-transferring), partial [Casimicrobiaceae bacterium]
MEPPAAPARATLADLEGHDAFIARHIGASAFDQAAMLKELGYPTRSAMIERLIPAAIRRNAAMDLPASCTEAEALAELRTIASKNKVLKSCIGQGYYSTHTPGVILRNILENPAWYTAYTPYQPEIAQGRLEALINFQTMICDMTGMAIANASMLDEATAAAEAMTLARRVAKNKSNVFIVASDCHPQTIEVVQTRAKPLGIEVVVGVLAQLITQREFFGVLAQYPSTTGLIHDMRPLVDPIHAKNALLCVASDLLALTLLAPPGEWGADVVVGNSQRFGVPLGFGGPHAGFFATRDEFKRTMPGRLVGATIDAQGGHAYRLALQTREQHIRRE